MPKTDSDIDTLFLPNLCGIRAVFFVVLIAELFAFFLALAPMDIPMSQRWYQLGLISLFVQWCALASCSILCIARPYLRRFSNIKAGIISYIIVLAVISIITELTYYFIYANSVELYPQSWHLHFFLRNLAMGAILTGPVLRYFYIQNQWRQNVRAETESRVQALQSRIRPHFLFNSMNTIASLTRSDPEKAETAVENLADLFRVSLSDARKQVSLEEELELCRRYIEIEQLRLGDRLNVEWDLDVPNDAQVPALLLQPLLENAIYHGIESQTEGGSIKIKGALNDKQIVFILSNSMPDKNSPQRQHGNQIAQDNVRERLSALYAHRGKLDITETDHTYQVSLQFPYERPDQVEKHEDFDR
ncbi:MAG: histidine kinase [Gammaproteobacteria bacterium]|nr:histidine kinase [Gammaproteobacteria bacterium]MCW8986488.1 histidine kinase [Gammaproteobacteria bacterium]MCW9030008.1 histidine kinase [Gammaproteobacteria bacterium]